MTQLNEFGSAKNKIEYQEESSHPLYEIYLYSERVFFFFFKPHWDTPNIFFFPVFQKDKRIKMLDHSKETEMKQVYAIKKKSNS